MQYRDETEKMTGQKECPLSENSLYEKLNRYDRSDFYPFHMPGHKRQFRPIMDPYGIDITEIDGFDNLHHAETILREAQDRAAGLYHAEETFYLINGSTSGILAAVSAAVRRGGTILMARNCHKAVYHAALLNDLQTGYLYPRADMVRGLNGAIDPEEVRTALRNDPKISAVLITSPTYDGVVSDVRAIADIAHEAGAVLIVDEAHGAHFGMHPYFPKHSLDCGADLVINSAHKTLPAPTQTAFLHVQGTGVDRERLRTYLGIYQTSSPSYVLMAGMDACVRLLQEQGTELFEQFAVRLERLRADLAQMKTLHLIDGQEPELYCFDYDRSKVLISTERSAIGGAELCGLLREQYHLEMEMEAEQYVTAITTLADTQEGLVRLRDALLELDRELTESKEQTRKKEQTESREQTRKKGQTESKKQTENDVPDSRNASLYIPNEICCTIAAANDAEKETIPLVESAGRVSGEFIYLYPPGIPLVVPGERISKPLLEKLEQYREQGLRLQGLADYEARQIRALAVGL